MKKTILILSIVGLAPFCFAQQGRVVQAKGKRAIVEFPSGPPAPGTMVSVDGGGSMMSMGSGGGSRQHTIGLSGSLISSSGGSASSTAIGVTGKYGWNTGVMEYGPQVSVLTVTPGSNSAFSVGGFFDYNLVSNTPTQTMVYGLGATLDFGSSSSGGASSSTTSLFLGGNLKYFPFGVPVAVRADAGLGYRPASGSVSATTSFGILFALQVYY